MKFNKRLNGMRYLRAAFVPGFASIAQRVAEVAHPISRALCVGMRDLKRFEENNVSIQSVSDFGLTLELFIEESVQNIEYPLLKVYADDKTEDLYLEIPTSSGLVQVPLKSVQKFLSMAETEVHSEKWFDNNVFNNTDT